MQLPSPHSWTYFRSFRRLPMLHLFDLLKITMFHGKAGLLLSFIVNIDSILKWASNPQPSFKCNTLNFFSTFLCDFVPIIPFLCLSLAIRGGEEKNKNQCQKQNWASKGLHNEETREKNGAEREREREIQLEKRGMGGGQRKLRKGYKWRKTVLKVQVCFFAPPFLLLFLPHKTMEMQMLLISTTSERTCSD